MGRSLEEVIASLPADQRREVDRRVAELTAEIETLQQLRKLAERLQADVAVALQATQPAISRLERQTDMYLSTLRSYVEAVGGELDIVVRLPNRAEIRLKGLGDLVGE